MSRVKKAANPERKRDYPPEAGVELQGKEGEHSIAPASAEGEDGNRVNTGKLLEKVLDRENMVRASDNPYWKGSTDLIRYAG